jgi:hypothetical protein
MFPVASIIPSAAHRMANSLPGVTTQADSSELEKVSTNHQHPKNWNSRILFQTLHQGTTIPCSLPAKTVCSHSA